jgi:hypothetical protein
MDPATASIIAAVVSAIASIAVALITTRTRINIPVSPARPTGDILDKEFADAQTKPIGSVKIFRWLGWCLVVFLYFMGSALILFSVSFFFDPIRYGVEGMSAILAGLLSLSAFCFMVGFWASRRLRNKRYKIDRSPQISN